MITNEIKFFMDAGLTQKQAEQLVNCKAEYKLELLPALLKVLNSKRLTTAFKHHPAQTGNLKHWTNSYLTDVRSELENVSMTTFQEIELARMVKAITKK